MEITYVIQKSRQRSMSIQVADDRKIIVKVPLGTPTFVAENFIREKKDWITKQIEKIEKQSEHADSMGPPNQEKGEGNNSAKGGVLLQNGRHFLQPHFYPSAEIALGKLFCRRESKLQLPAGADAT